MGWFTPVRGDFGTVDEYGQYRHGTEESLVRLQCVRRTPLPRNHFGGIDGERFGDDVRLGTLDSISTRKGGSLYHGTTSTNYIGRINDDVGQGHSRDSTTRHRSPLSRNRWVSTVRGVGLDFTV